MLSPLFLFKIINSFYVFAQHNWKVEFSLRYKSMTYLYQEIPVLTVLKIKLPKISNYI